EGTRDRRAVNISVPGAAGFPPPHRSPRFHSRSRRSVPQARHVGEVVVRQPLLADVVDGLVERLDELAEVLLVEVERVLPVVRLADALALGDREEVVVAGAGGLDVEEVGALTGGDALAEDLVSVAFAV